LLLVQVKVSPVIATPLLSAALGVIVSAMSVSVRDVTDAVMVTVARAPGVAAAGVDEELELLEQLARKTQEAASKRSVRGVPGKRGRRVEIDAFSVMRRPNFLRQRFHAALLRISKCPGANRAIRWVNREMHRGL
jgi:hypothetical protein